MSQDEQELLESIDNRLKWLLQLRVEEQFDEASNKEKVEMLYKMGFSNQEMAEVIGASKSTISTTVSRLRKGGEIE